MIEVEKLRKTYKDIIILDNCSAVFDKGITCIVGDKKSGKSTFLQAVAGLVEVEGEVIIPENVRLGYYEDKIEAPEFLSGEQYLYAIAEKRGMSKKAAGIMVRQAAQKLGFTKLQMSVPIRAYTLQERKRIQIAQAMIEGAEVILLDGLFEAFDDNDMAQVMEVLADMGDTCTIIITGNSAEAVERWCNIYYLVDGRLLKGERR